MRKPEPTPGTVSPVDPWLFSAGRPGYERETFEGPSQLLPELEILGWLRFHTSLPGGLKADRHEGVYEIHYMVRGHLRWWVGEEQHEFSTGRVFIVRPGELHGGDDASLQPCEHYWLRIRFPSGDALPALSAAETRRLSEAYERLTYRTFIASREVYELFHRLHEEHRRPQSAFVVLMARATLQALLVIILRDHDQHCQLANQKPMVTWRVRRTLEWLESQLDQSGVSLDQAAANVGLSLVGLRARFKAETGYTLHEYLLHRRVEEARRRLAGTNEEITTIAHHLGFSSSQYFATAFRRQTGVTPGDYRQKHRVTPA
jgi:AraC family transcriptional regulator, L-rhamnose operon regulatory protein RhaS